MSYPGVDSRKAGWTQLERSDLTVLVVRGDGRSVHWMSIPRRFAKTILTLAAIGVVVNGAALFHYVSLYREHASIVAANDYLERHASAVAPLRRRLGEVRDEMRTWERLHAEVLKSLGGQPRATPVGIGGPGRKARDEIDVLVAYVREESRRLQALAHATRETGDFLAALPARLPLRSALNSQFGPRLSPWTGEPELHSGIDLAANVGTPLKATTAGVVRFTGTSEGYGQTVFLDHGAGVESRYGHLQKISVTRGQRVERGQLIGHTGNSGRSTAPHLHYEVLVDGRPVDPRRLARE
jgi:murein DD-endopeptidase MepM/ murein hydrolase activator NlpD